MSSQHVCWFEPPILLSSSQAYGHQQTSYSVGSARSHLALSLDHFHYVCQENRTGQLCFRGGIQAGENCSSDSEAVCQCKWPGRRQTEQDYCSALFGEKAGPQAGGSNYRGRVKRES